MTATTTHSAGDTAALASWSAARGIVIRGTARRGRIVYLLTGGDMVTRTAVAVAMAAVDPDRPSVIASTLTTTRLSFTNDREV